MALTNKTAADLVTEALKTGRPLTVECNNGDKVTCGRAPNGGFNALRWGRSRWAEPCGRELENTHRAQHVAFTVVQHCGRGNAAKAARKVLGK